MEKALLWDFDGTLVYQVEPFIKSAEYAFEQCGISLEREEIVAGLKNVLPWLKPEEDYTGCSGDLWWDALFERMFRQFDMDAGACNQFRVLYRDKIIDWSKYSLYADTIPVLQKCLDMGYRNYVMSNNYPELPQVVEQLGLGGYFADCFVSARIGYEKPRKELFAYALAQAGNPDCCYMIGDNPIADIEGGRGVGLKTILVHRDCASNANYTCKELSEIPALLD